MPRPKVIKTSANDSTAFECSLVTNKINQMEDKFTEIISDFTTLRAEATQISHLNEEIKELKETVCSQNKVIVDLISELKVIVETNICPGKISSKYADSFPICSVAELDDVEEEISDTTKTSMIATLSKILAEGGLRKNLANIFDISLLLQFNVEGKQGKKRLLDYPKLLDAIYNVIDSKESISKRQFLAQLRKSLRLEKNLYYKNESVKRNESSTQNNSFLED